MATLLNGVHNLEDALGVAGKIHRLAGQPIESQGTQLITSLSIGVALAQAGESLDALIGRANGAMYQAKQGGRNRVTAIE